LKLVVLTQYYAPEIGAPPNRLSALVKGLTDAGHGVTVLTAMPNYPIGRYYPGYGGLFRRESHNGSVVVRTFIYPTQSAGMMKRLLCYFTFVFSSVVLGGWFLDEPDYIFTESPPLFLGLSGFLLSRWKRARWIFNV
jgi:colanic acid biosynthesis glycosyl transferase WcaI